MRDLAQENEDYVEEVDCDISDVSWFAELEEMAEEDLEWDADEDAIA